MFVTFESMLVGFEINTTFMTSKQNELLNKIQNNKEIVFNIESKIKEISTLDEETIRENFKNDLIFFENNRKERLDENSKRIQSSNDKRKERLDENSKRIQSSNDKRKRKT